MANKVSTATTFKWRHNLQRKSRTPTSAKDFTRITWFLDDETKQGIYEYRDIEGNTNCIALTTRLQEQLSELVDKKYYDASERSIIFFFFFNEIRDFIDASVEDEEFFNFCGVDKYVFFSSDSYDNLMDKVTELL